MERWKQIVCASILIAAVLVICFAPAYNIQPTALRAWNSSMGMLAALSTLIVLSLAIPSGCVRFFLESDRPHSLAGDLLRVTCSLLI